VKEPFLGKISYIMRLGEGFAWNLVGTDATEVWVDRLAATMGLEPGNLGNYPSIEYILGAKTNALDRVSIAEPDSGKPSFLKKSKWQISGLPWMRICSTPERLDLLCEFYNVPQDIVSALMLLSLDPIYEAAIRKGGIPLHAALIGHSGRGVLLIGDHDAGKTTCCNRLPSTWITLCDDETFVLEGSHGYHAHPFPRWSAYLYGLPQQPLDVSRGMPLAAIFFLEKAARLGIAPIGVGESVVRINASARQACLRRMHGFETCVRRELRTRMLDIACKIAREVPAYVLRTSMECRFWEAIEAAVVS
jgi:SynChlorMet cassette protein ScmC